MAPERTENELASKVRWLLVGRLVAAVLSVALLALLGGRPAAYLVPATALVLDVVYFDTGKATIQKRSHKLLDNVASVLSKHPEIKKISSAQTIAILLLIVGVMAMLSVGMRAGPF